MTKNSPKHGTYTRDFKNSKDYLKGVVPNISRGKCRHGTKKGK